MYEDFEGAEVQEAADPAVQDAEPTEVEETQDTINPEPGAEDKSTEAEGNSDSANRAFAEMRRQVEEYERENARLQKQIELQDSALGLYVEGDDKTAAAIAQATGLSLEEVRSTIAEQDELEELRARAERSEAELEDLQIEQMMADDLMELKSIDPNIEFDDLPDNFFDLIGAGVDATTAYYASQKANEVNRTEPMKAPGEVATGGETKTYYTKEEVEKMTPEQVRAHMKAIEASMKHWKY